MTSALVILGLYFRLLPTPQLLGFDTFNNRVTDGLGAVQMRRYLSL